MGSSDAPLPFEPLGRRGLLRARTADPEEPDRILFRFAPLGEGDEGTSSSAVSTEFPSRLANTSIRVIGVPLLLGEDVLKVIGQHFQYLAIRYNF